MFSHQFDNGLVLVAEPMQWLESAAFTFLLPVGAMRDPEKSLGLSNYTCEMVQRGCGSRDSRQFIQDLETLGVAKSASVSISHTSFAAAMPAGQIEAALKIYADLVRRPHLPSEQMEEGRLVCLQELRAIDDDLAQKVMQTVRRQQYASPYGRNVQGNHDSVQQITIEQVQQHYQTCYRPNQAILGVAGKIEWDSLKEHVGTLFADWEAADLPAVEEGDRESSYVHLSEQSEQTHIGLSYPSVPYSDPDYFQARGAVGVLSDGMSSRLFTEVRENRGLCYTVYASCHTLRDRGAIIAYAGTTTDRAQETLDVMSGELIRLPGDTPSPCPESYHTGQTCPGGACCNFVTTRCPTACRLLPSAMTRPTPQQLAISSEPEPVMKLMNFQGSAISWNTWPSREQLIERLLKSTSN